MTTSQESDSELTSALPTVDPTPPKRSPSWVLRLGRWLLALVIIGGLGFGVYLLWPSIDERFLQPVSNNSDDILTLTDRIDALEARVAEVESRTARIVEDGQTNTTGVEAVEGQLAELDAKLDAQLARIEGLEDTAFALAAADEVAAARTEHEVTVLRAMGLMSRARLSLYQANYGLAQQDLAAARGVLSEIEAPDATIRQVLDRIDASSAALPDLPVPAAADLDIAWQLLVGDISATPSSTVATDSTTTTAPEATTTTVGDTVPDS